MRAFVIPAVLGLILAVSFGGFLHGAVQHSHGDEHGRAESALWSDLHGSLKHEDKKALYMLFETTLLMVLAIVSLVLATSQGYECAHMVASMRDPLVRSYVRRGVAKYRKFR